jgi:hypothetical protein
MPESNMATLLGHLEPPFSLKNRDNFPTLHDVYLYTSKHVANMIELPGVPHGDLLMGCLAHDTARAHVARGFEKLLGQPAIALPSGLFFVFAAMLHLDQKSIFQYLRSQ